MTKLSRQIQVSVLLPLQKFLVGLPLRLSIGHERSVRAKRNILALLVLKGFSVITNFLIVSITLDYLKPVKYGVWLTISSIVSWFTFFDIGLGNGLRNKFAEALATNRTDLARTYVSTSYAILFLILMISYLVFVSFSSMIQWTDALNTPTEMEGELTILLMIVVCLFCVRLLFGLIGTILSADQKPALSSLIDVVASFCALVLVYFLTKTTSGSLTLLGLTMSATSAIAPVLFSIYFFLTSYKQYSPRFRFVKMEYAKSLASLGLKFFFLQLSVLLLFSTSSIIITQLLGPAQVTTYNIAFKYFSIINVLFSTITAPLWSAYTEAFYKDDINWVRNATKKLTLVWVGMVFLVLAMLAFAETFYHLWIQEQVTVPPILSLLVALFVLIAAWNSIFIYFINGVGKIRLQLVSSMVSGLACIPLAIAFVTNLGLGCEGVVAASCLCLLPNSVLMPIQFSKICARTDRGIWSM